MPRPRAEDPEAAVLEPKLTNYDRRLIRACPQWPDGWPAIPKEERERITAWGVAEKLHEYDVARVMQTLKALEEFGHIRSNGHYMPHKRIWWRNEL